MKHCCTYCDSLCTCLEVDEGAGSLCRSDVPQSLELSEVVHSSSQWIHHGLRTEKSFPRSSIWVLSQRVVDQSRRPQGSVSVIGQRQQGVVHYLREWECLHQL